MSTPVTIRRLATGVPGLDAILGGGLPEYSFNLIVGPPGSGKTTLAHQILFALATPERPALYFSILGEPPLKMLRYQQQFSFFDLDKVNTAVRFINLNDDLAGDNFEPVLARIVREFEVASPALVCIDSFQSVMRAARQQSAGMASMQRFVQALGALLSSWQATTFLIGGYVDESSSLPVFTVADGILSLSQNVFRNSMVRTLQILKLRGQANLPGMHTFRTTSAGIAVFPAAIVNGDSGAVSTEQHPPRRKQRLAMGVPHLDEMLGGGLPEGYSLLVAGPSGSGKTILATAFLAEGVRLGEPGLIVAFEQTPSQSWTHTIDELVRAGQIGLINTRLLDLSMDEIVHQTTEIIHRLGVRRIVIDSLSGFELAVAPTFREDFRESLFRMTAVLASQGVTVLMTSELEDRYLDLRFSPNGAAFLTDAIVVQRYVEIESRLRRVMAVVKVRGSAHSDEIRQFEIVRGDIVIGEPVLDFEGLLCGRPTRSPAFEAAPRDGQR